MSDRNRQRAARSVQRECGTKYCAALGFVVKRWDNIVALATVEGKIAWKEVPSAAVGLWRREHPEASHGM